MTKIETAKIRDLRNLRQHYDRLLEILEIPQGFHDGSQRSEAVVEFTAKSYVKRAKAAEMLDKALIEFCERITKNSLGL